VYIKGDSAEIREVVLNLIFNAADAMPDGGVMEVGTRGEIDSGCFWVADTAVWDAARDSRKDLRTILHY